MHFLESKRIRIILVNLKLKSLKTNSINWSTALIWLILLIENQFNVNVKPQCSIFIHIIHSRTKEMTEHTEKDVLMKCTKCGYEEKVPRWLIDELFPNEPEENYMMHCPKCDHKMIVKK